MNRPPRTLYSCVECGTSQPRWAGRCPACGAWNSLVEENAPPTRGRAAATREPVEARPLGRAQAAAEARLPTGFPEVDRLLGGGLVAGGTCLIGGDPGIGKSTLLLQVAARLAAERPGLYLAAEEGPDQIDARAGRLGLQAPRLDVLGAASLETLLEALEAGSYAFAIVDSIQLLRGEALAGGPGSVGQVRECAARIAEAARAKGTAVVLVSHVTKEGGLAGPKTVEHMVDVVLEFEGDAQRDLRILRCSKNRFGPTAEVAVFAMTGAGLEIVADPARTFLTQAPGAEGPSGCAVTCLLEGSQPLFVEVQALVARSAYGTPQRVAQGLDARRLALLLAVLERRAGLGLGASDVFVKAVGGLGLREPVADLALAVALAGSHADRATRPGWIFLGELGLGGELRGVPRLGRRLEEAARLGFRGAVVPAAGERVAARAAGLRVVQAPDLSSALRLSFPAPAPGGDRRAARPRGSEAEAAESLARPVGAG
ncbi:MAG TPA: DNA repair protein RadA [Gemmatimonadota bacterium]